MGHPYKSAQAAHDAANAGAQQLPQQQEATAPSTREVARQAATPAPAKRGTFAGTSDNSVLVRIAESYGMEPNVFLSVVRDTLMPPVKDTGSVSNEQLAAFFLVATKYSLDPFTKQIYAFPAKRGGITPIVGIDGWYAIANAHPQYDGDTQRPVFDEHLGVGIETTIHRKDRSHPTIRAEWLSECTRNTEPWQKWPSRMLGHKSFIQCCRAAFGLSGIYDPDEGERIRDGELELPKVALPPATATVKPDPAPAPALRPVTAVAAVPVSEPAAAAAPVEQPYYEIVDQAPPEAEVAQEQPARRPNPTGSVRDEHGRYSRGDDPEGNPACPDCGGPMWDNRGRSHNPKAAEWACKGELPGLDLCEGRRWPRKANGEEVTNG